MVDEETRFPYRAREVTSRSKRKGREGEKYFFKMVMGGS